MTIYLQKKDLQLFICSIKILLKMGSLTKKKDTSNDIGCYTVKLIKKNNKDFIQKKIYFNKLRLVSKIKKKNNHVNVIFLKYHNKIYPFKLEITNSFVAKFSGAVDKGNNYKFLFDIIFSSPTDTKKFMLVKSKVFLSSRYPSAFHRKS